MMFEKYSISQLHQMAEELALIPEREGRMQSTSEFHRQKAIESAIDERQAAVKDVPPMVIQQERDRNTRPKPPSQLAYFDSQKREWVSAKTREEVAADLQRNSDAPSLGGMIAGQVTGRWQGLEREHAAVLGQTDSSGGFLVGETTSSQVIGYAFNKTVLAAAGMKQIPFPTNSDTLRIGRVLTPPVAYWRGEGGAITASSPTFEQIVLMPKVLGVLVPVSIEFLSDVANSQQMLEQVIADAISTEIDRAVLYGVGGNELSGLSTMTGVNKTTGVGVWTTETLINQCETIWNYNGPRNGLACILDSDAESHRLKLVDGNGQYIVGQANPAQDLNYLMTENVTAGDMFIGDFSRVVMGVKDSLRVEVLPAGTGTDASGTTYNATSEMYRWIRVYARLDFGCEKPEHVCYLTGLTNS